VEGVSATLEGLELLHGKSAMPLIGDDFTIRLLPETPPRAIRLRCIGPINEQPDRNATNIDGSRNLKRPAIVLGHSLFTRAHVNAILIGLCDILSEDSRLEANLNA
jgi:hypothetical protein